MVSTGMFGFRSKQDSGWPMMSAMMKRRATSATNVMAHCCAATKVTLLSSLFEAESRWLDGKMLDGAVRFKVNISFGVLVAIKTRKADQVAPLKTLATSKLWAEACLVAKSHHPVVG